MEVHPGRLTAGTYKSPMKRKENDLNQTSMIMFHVNLQGCAVDGSEIQRENHLIWRIHHHLQDSVIHTSQTVQDFFHQPYVGKYQGSCSESQEMRLDVGLGSLE